MNYAICGSPRCGKTVLAARLANEYRLPVISTDSYMSHSWASIPERVVTDLLKHESWILEGVQAARVIRLLIKLPRMPLPSCVYWLTRPFVDLTEGQASLAKGVSTVFEEIRPSLYKRGIAVFPGVPGI